MIKLQYTILIWYIQSFRLAQTLINNNDVYTLEHNFQMLTMKEDKYSKNLNNKL